MMQTKQRPGWGEILGFGMLVIALGLLIWPPGGRDTEPLVAPGTPLPSLMAEGWINTPDAGPPTTLAGKVVLVDCWATWCPPCRESLPKLARLYAKYQPLGVEFVGLTPEGARERAAVESFIKTVPGFDWPVGWGSNPTLDMLGIRLFPTLIVFDARGNAVWSSTSTDGIEAALDEAVGKQNM